MGRCGKQLLFCARIPALILLALLTFFSSVGCCENLLLNGTLSEKESDGLPVDWFTEAYINDPGFTVFSGGTDENGTNWVEIRNIGFNDARFAQTVDVEPETLYRFSAEVYADHVEEGHGANLSVEGLYAFSREIFDTGGEWETLEWYGETGSEQRSVTLFARLGGYSGLSKGRACFRKLLLEEVRAVPGEEIAAKWFSDDSPGVGDTDDAEGEQPFSPFYPWLMVMAVLYGGAGFLLIHRKWPEADPALSEKATRSRHGIILFFALLLSFMLRMVISYNVSGYQVDVNCFVSWGRTMAQSGPARFYQSTGFCDYPPLYMAVLGINSLLSSGASEGMTRVIFRLVPNLCDLTACWFLYRLIRRKKAMDSTKALTAAIMLSLNPALILNSAAWGQMDSVLCLLLLLTAFLVTERKWEAALPLFTLSVLIKPQALLFGPLGLFWFICDWMKYPSLRKRMLLSLPLSVLAFLLVVLPFTGEQSPDWIWKLYAGTLSSYPYVSINAANWGYLMGGNWLSLNLPAGMIPCLFLSGLGILYASWWNLRFRSLQRGWVECAAGMLFSVLCAVFAFTDASWSALGTASMIFCFVVVFSLIIRSPRGKTISFYGALILILLFVFGLKMHERYLFPAILLLALAWVERRDHRILYLILLFSGTLLINQGIILDNSIRLGSSAGHLNQDTVWLADLLSILNCLGALYAVRLGGCFMTESEPVSPFLFTRQPVRSEAREEPFHPDPGLHWKKRDWLLTLLITVPYAVLSLTTLGSTKAPQRIWTSSSDEEQVVFDLGGNSIPKYILYFGQVSRNDFSFAESEDMIHWSDEVWAQMEESQCWKWKYVTLYANNSDGSRNYYNGSLDHLIPFTGRYIRLSAGQIGLKLNEILFRDLNGAILPATIVSHTGGAAESELFSDPALLLDEQDTLENLPGLLGKSATETAEPSWWNSTYFDEIYHARTAYEFIQGTVPYETSHPPLGKLLMSCFILLFGMTPFGWRFAGALAGVCMLPALYLLVKQLTKKTWAAALACSLFALDCQHLTQTQIATIDSFPVLFILLSFWFMLRFLQMEPAVTPFGRSLCPLFFSGLFMGLAIASKWIGIYAGIGLAILFFGYWLYWGVQYARAFHVHPDDEPCVTHGSSFISARFAKTSLWCLLFFVLIPLCIYLLTYIPYMAYNHRIRTLWDYIQAVYQAQVGMLNYHSRPRLGMDHPFYSPWWEWPVIGKPMYFASKQYLPAGSPLSFSIFCFGNPVIWFGALGALAICLLRLIFHLHAKHFSSASGKRICLLSRESVMRYIFLWVGLLSQYLPWVLVPRGTYIYHYFASVPFIIIGIVLFVLDLPKVTEKNRMILSGLIAAVSFFSFLVFLPYACGLAAPTWWLDLGKSVLKIWY